MAALISVLLLGAASDLIISSVRQGNAISSRSIAVTRGELVLARMTREVREAQRITNSTTGANETPVNVTYTGSSPVTSTVSFYLPVAGSTAAGTHVTWSCEAGGSCTRTEGTKSAVTELIGVKSASFTPYGSGGTQLASGAGAAGSPSYPSSLQVALEVQNISQSDLTQTHTTYAPNSPITLRNGVDLRNYS